MSSVLEIVVLGEDRASGVLRGIGGALNSFGDSARRVGMDLLPISAGAALVAGGALKMAADYERSMDVLQASTGASTLEMQALDKMAVALGGDMTLPATSAKDAAEAMLELSKSGLSVTDTMAAARGVLQLSAAAQISNSEAALITANALNMFKLSGDKATEVADLLAAGANKSSANIGQMAEALQMSGNVASMAGLSIGDLTTAIALMANQGVAGSDAGTSIKTMLLSLQAPTKRSRELMDALGISIYDAQGKMLPMPNLIANFSTALGGLSQQQQNAALKTIFGSDAIRAANVLIMGGTQAWNDMSLAVNAGGAAAEMAAAQNKGLSGALDGLRSVVETVLLTAARPLLDTLSGIVRWIGDLVGKFAEANPQLMTAGLAFAGVLAVAAPLALGIGLISTALGALLAPVGAVVLAVGALAAAWTTNFGNIQGIVAEVVATVQGILGQLQSFVTEHSAQILGPLNTAWTTIQTLVTAAVNAIWSIVSTLLGQVQTFIASHGEQITNFMLTAWQAIGDIINTTLAIIQATIIPALQAIATFISEHGAEIQAIFSVVWAAISGSISAVLTVIQGILKAALQVIQGDWSGAWETMKETGVRLWTIISSTITTIAAALAPLLAAIWAGIKQAAETAWENMKTAAAAAWENMKTAAAQKWEAIKAAIAQKLADMITAVVKWLDDTLAKIEGFTLLDAAKFLFGTLLPGIAARLSEALTSIAKWLKDVFEKISHHDLKPAAQTSFGTVVAGIAAKVPEIMKTVISFLDKAAANIKGYTLKSQTMTAIQTVIAGILSMVADILQAVLDMLNSIKNTIANFSLRDVGVALVQGLIDGIKSMIGAAISAAVNLVKSVIAAAWNAANAHSPSREMIELAIAMVNGLIVGFDNKKAEAAQKMAEVIAAICEAAVKAADALRDFRPVNNLGVITSQIMDFLLGVETQFAALVKEVDQELATKAKEFADALEPVVSILSSAMETLNGFVTMLPQPDWPGIQSKIGLIVAFIGKVAGELGIVSLAVGGILQDAAQEFVEKLGNASEIIASATEAMNGLATMIPQPDWRGMQAKIMQIVAFIGKVAGELGVAGLAVGGVLQDAAKQFAENVAPVIDIITGGLEALAALRVFERLDAAARETIIYNMMTLDRFLASLVADLAKVAGVVKEDLQVAARIFADNVGPAIDIIVGGLEALAALRVFERLDSAARETIIYNMMTLDRFLATLVADLGRIGTMIETNLQSAARVFAENAGPAIDIIMGGLEALAALREFKRLDAAGRETVIANMMTLDRFLASLVADLGRIGTMIETDLQAAAKTFAENAGPVIGIVKNAVEAMTVLGGDLAMPENLTAKLDDLNNFIYALVGKLSRIAGRISAELQTAAKEFATNAGPVLGIVKNAVEAMTALGKDVVMPENLTAKLDDLNNFIYALVGKLSRIAGRISAELQTAAKEFATNAGPVLGIVKNAVEAMTALGKDVVMPENLTAKLDDLNNFIYALVGKLSRIASRITAELQTAAKEFATNAGPVLGIVKNGVEAMTALGGDVIMPENLTAKLDDLNNFIYALVGKLSRIATRISSDLQTAAKDFATNAGPVIGIVKNAVEAMTALGKDVVMPENLTAKLDTMDNFIYALVGKLGRIAEKITGELQTAAKEFAQNAGPVLGIVKNAVEAMTALGEEFIMPTNITAKLDTLGEFIASVVIALGKTSATVGTDLLTAAKAFAENAKPVMDILENAMKGYNAVGGFSYLATSEAGIVGLPKFIARMVSSMAEASRALTEDLRKEASAFAADAEFVMKVVLSSVKSLTDFSELQAKLAGGKKAMLPAIELLDSGVEFMAIMAERIAAMGQRLGNTVLADAKFVGMQLAVPMQMIVDAVKGLEQVSKVDLTKLNRSGWALGFDWITGMADGIKSGMDYLVAALAAVADLFPHSPAKAGPLKVTPNWSAWMTGGLDDAAGMVSSALAWQMPRSLLAGGMGQSGGTTANSTTVNINGPTIRDEMDIRRLADAVSMVLTNQQSTNRRLGATW